MTTTERILTTIAETPGITYRELWRRMAPLGRTIIDPILREYLERGEIRASIDSTDRDASTFRLARASDERLALARHRQEIRGGVPARFPDPREGMTR